MNGLFKLKSHTSEYAEYYFAPFGFENKSSDFWGVVKINRDNGQKEVIKSYNGANDMDTWGIMRFGLGQLLPKMVDRQLPEKIEYAIG